MSVKKHLSTNTMIKVECLCCGIETNHKVLVALKNFQDYERVWLSSICQIIQCQGCENITFREESKFSEDDGPQIHLYPSREKDNRINLISNDEKNIPEKVYYIYAETIKCYYNECNILCAAGLRAIIESIFAEKGIEVRDKNGILNERPDVMCKINNLEKSKFITPIQAKSLHELRFLGNSAIHETIPPTQFILNKAIHIIESVLSHMYIIPLEGKELEKIREEMKEKK